MDCKIQADQFNLMKHLSELRERRFPLKEEDGRNDETLGKNNSLAMPNATAYPHGDSYFHYRAMVMSASLPDTPKIPPYSFTADQPFSIGYTQADNDMIAAAAKLCGYPGKTLSGPKSTESEEIHRHSPVNHNSGKSR